MTENRRIFLNIIATYGRSLFAMVCGILGGRWALMALGEVDYGLQGLAGGLTAFIGFLCGVLSAAVGRFYALAIGKARTDPAAGLEEAQRWFSIALLIHTLIPISLLIVGLPLGEWAIRDFLTIPTERVQACVWVFRFSCFSCFVGMVTVPFNAFYGAKQYIAELTIYGFLTTILNTGMLYYMVSHPAVWMVKYSLWLTILGFLPAMVITGRAIKLFPECRFRLSYCRDANRFRQLFAYAFWQFFGSLSVLMRGQGIAILVNKYFGPSFNASLAIARNVNGKANELGASMQGAFTPAITNAWGAQDYERARMLALKVCKFGVLGSFVFVLPLMSELPYVMRLWLKAPPDWVIPLCYAVMVQLLINRTTRGHLILLQATGKIGLYESVAAGLSLTMLPTAWALIELGMGPWGVCLSFVVVTAAYAWVRPFFAARHAGLLVRPWALRIMVPLLVIAVGSLAAGFFPHLFLDEGLGRLLVAVVLCETVLLGLAWWILFDVDERNLVLQKLIGERTAWRIRSAFTAYATDARTRAEGETGGMVTAILLYLLQSGRIDGAVVSRYSSETKSCEALFANDAETIAGCAGSVYCRTPVVQRVKEYANHRLAVVAVGCQARALARLRSRGLIPAETVIIGLICGGTYQNDYIPAICEANGVRWEFVSGFRFKDKRYGKWPGNTMIKTLGQWRDFPGDARKELKGKYLNAGCAQCHDKMNVMSDVVMGDPWGTSVPDAARKEGVNVVIARTKLGQEVLADAVRAKAICVQEAQPREIFAGQKTPFRRGLLGRILYGQSS